MEFLNDIFISYPAPLNRTPYAGWVLEFENGLKNAFEEHAKMLSAPEIYVDHYKVGANSIHEDMLERARRSRLFLAIVSPDYQERAWAPKELAAFAAELSDRNRLFVIATKPLPEDEIRLESLKGRPIKTFYTKSNSAMGHPMPFHPTSREFQDGVYALAHAMAVKLIQMRGAETRFSSSSPPPVDRSRVATGSQSTPRTILVAQVTDDLESEVRSVISELELQCRDGAVKIIDANEYPLGGADFRAAFEADLSGASLVVQLLSESPGKHPRDLPEGYVAYQAQKAATQPGATLAQWRRSNIDASLVQNATQRALLEAETVTASTLAAFKGDLVEWIRNLATKSEPTKAESSPSGLQVFINASASDLPAAVRLRDAISELCASVWLPPQGNPDSESIRKELEKLLQDCDSLLFMNGGVEPVWISSQLRQAVKVRVSRRLPMHGAICDGPPPEKLDLHGVVKGLERLACSTIDGAGWQFDPVRNFLKDAATGIEL